MADSQEEKVPETPTEPTVPEAAPPAPPPEDDVLFRIQIAVSDFIVSNARFAGYAMGIALVVALVYGGWQSWREHQMDEDFSAIARIDYKMPKPSPLSEMGFGPADDPTDAGKMKDLETGAGLYEEVARKAEGAAAVTAWLHAADAWKRANKPDKQLEALRAAAAAGHDDAVGYAAKMVLASVLLEQDKKDEALAIYQEIGDKHSDFLGQEAWATLIRTQVSLGRMEEAKTAYANFHTKFPTANRPDLDALHLGSGS